MQYKLDLSLIIFCFVKLLGFHDRLISGKPRKNYKFTTLQYDLCVVVAN